MMMMMMIDNNSDGYGYGCGDVISREVLSYYTLCSLFLSTV